MTNSRLANRLKVSTAIMCLIALLLAASFTLNISVAARSVGHRFNSAAQQVTLYRGNPQRTGAYSEAAIRQMSRVHWQIDSADGWPVFADGVVYIPQNGRLKALDGATGQEIWSVNAKPATPLFSPVTVADGVVYFGEGNHNNREGPRYFYAVDAATGQELWKYHADGRIFAAAAIGGGAVYFVTFVGRMFAIE